jgi:hypothetical protein
MRPGFGLPASPALEARAYSIPWTANCVKKSLPASAPQKLRQSDWRNPGAKTAIRRNVEARAELMEYAPVLFSSRGSRGAHR